MKDSIELEPPGNNHVPIGPRAEESGSLVALTVFDDVPLDLRNGSVKVRELPKA